MGDTSGCQINSNNLAVYLQGVTVTPSSNITSEYFVTASLPSSASTKRVWQFQSQGTLTGPLTATLTLDYTIAHENCPNYNITFDGRLNGTFIVHNQVFSANKFISYQLTSTYVLVLTLRIPKTILECFGDKPQHYSFSVNLNDASATSSTYILDDFSQSDLNTTQVLQGTTSSGELCNWSNGQSYYYGGGYGISSSVNAYTGYLTLSPTVFSENSCSGPTTFVIDISSGFPTYSSTSNSYIVLGLQFDVGLSTPDPLTLTVSSANNTSTSNELYFASTGQYGVQLILVYSSSNTLNSYVLSPSNDENFFITVSPSSTVTYPILDASGYVMYETTASTVTLFATLGTSAIYISFATTPVSGYSLQLNNFSTSSTIYLNNPSTGSYQQVSITNTTSTTFYYCVAIATWQTYSCATLSFSYTTNNSLTSTVIEGSNDCTWSESQTYSYPGSYSNDANGNPVYTGYLQFAVISSSCTAPTNLVLSISDFPTTTTGTVLLGLEFDSTSSGGTNPSTIVIDYGATTMSTISLPSSTPYEFSGYGYILLYNASTGWQVQNYATALTSVLYVIISSYSSGIYILDTSGNTLYEYVDSSFYFGFLQQNPPTVYVSFISSPSQNESIIGYNTYSINSIYFATTVQQYQLIENFEMATNYYYCNTSWGTDSC